MTSTADGFNFVLQLSAAAARSLGCRPLSEAMEEVLDPTLQLQILDNISGIELSQVRWHNTTPEDHRSLITPNFQISLGFHTFR